MESSCFLVIMSRCQNSHRKENGWKEKERALDYAVIQTPASLKLRKASRANASWALSVQGKEFA